MLEIFINDVLVALTKCQQDTQASGGQTPP